jgi:hypothetical protein
MATMRGKLGKGAWEFRLYKNVIESLDEPGGQVYRHVDDLAERVGEKARELAPRATGALANSIKVTYENNAGRGGSRWYIVADTPYAKYVGKGTAPHPIVPKNKTILKFPAKGGTIVYTPQVQHPGTKANNFMQEALQTVIR